MTQCAGVCLACERRWSTPCFSEDFVELAINVCTYHRTQCRNTESLCISLCIKQFSEVVSLLLVAQIFL
jgi:hypothetical protein